MDNRNTPPGKVSPLIKGARWSFLFLGVVYGASRLNVLNKKEKARKEELERTRPEREAKLAAEKLKRAKEEEAELQKLISPQTTPQ